MRMGHKRVLPQLDREPPPEAPAGARWSAVPRAWVALRRLRAQQTPRPQAPAHRATGTLAWGPPSGCFPRAGWAPRGWLQADGHLRAQSRAYLRQQSGQKGWGTRVSTEVSKRRRKVKVPAVGRPGSSWAPDCRDPPSCLVLSACLAGAGGHQVDRRRRVGLPLCQAPATGAELPCKYPRFTRFMTSLAVKFATSSTEHTGRGTDRNRERDR